ncbi:Golgi-specific brefeldin A-resistance guanine nucleotide exchange factor 1-like [Sycon ciliatum]|uniref:Golgi-specific brefeldin A-resistance guanine nucleotide exchange factor 1-like n=1 Tax=Sycon ciliatum TaxID=27933 RepID=UPI0031F6498C
MSHSGVYIVQGEIALVLAAMKKGSRWRQDDDQDPLVDGFSQLKEVLTGVADLAQLDPDEYLTPFLDVIKSEDTTGPITGVALSSIHKFLSYGTIDASMASSAAAVANLADAVTHARFVGTDPASDEVVLMKILQVLRTLLLTEVGSLMTDECVCEIMQSCFRICFEARLSDLLRRTAEQTLMDMMQLLFLRLPHLTESARIAAATAEIHMLHRSSSSGQPSSPTETKTVDLNEKDRQPVATVSNANGPVGSRTGSGETATSQPTPPEILSSDEANVGGGSSASAGVVLTDQPLGMLLDNAQQLDTEGDSSTEGGGRSYLDSDTDNFANTHGVRFSQQPPKERLQPYGLSCVCELFRFLISLCNPADKHNSESMIHTALSLLTVALECGAAAMMHFPSLVGHIQDDLCRHLFSLLKSPGLSLYAGGLRVFFLLFASMRQILKFQLEMFLTNLQELIASDAQQATIERKEIALDFLVQLCRVPGFAAELYINFDCQPYTQDVLGGLTKLLSEHAYPVSGVQSTHRLCVDALLAIVQAIDSSSTGSGGSAAATNITLQQSRTRFDKTLQSLASPVKFGFGMRRCNSDPRLYSSAGSDQEPASATQPAAQDAGAPHLPPGSPQQVASWMQTSALPTGEAAGNPPSYFSSTAMAAASQTETQHRPMTNLFGVDFFNSMPTAKQLIEVKQKKKLLLVGTDLFNSKPKKGLTFLQEHGIFSSTVTAEECADFLKNNCRLDKKVIGEYIGERKNTEVMEQFVRKFDFANQSMDVGLRQFLESFRLPGEAPVILRLLEAFSAYWLECNPEAQEQVAEAESASVLAYAIIMLNTDQHNPRSVNPMTFQDFKRNQRGTNGGKNYPDEMLMEIYKNIKENEIVMPAEQTGEVKENYLWKLLLSRGTSSEGRFRHVSNGQLDQDVFHLVWGYVVAALSCIFENSQRQSVVVKSMIGFKKCASVAAHFQLSDVFDKLIIALCKFTLLLNPPDSTESFASIFGSNPKAQLTTRTLFSLARRYGDIISEGWKYILDCVLQLFRARLLPESLTKVDDFVDPSGSVCLLREEQTSQKSDSWFSWLDSGAGRKASAEEVESQNRASQCIKDCKVELLITESKFLRIESLKELVKALRFGSHGPAMHQSLGTQFDEDSAIFHLELLISIAIKNRDRLSPIWPELRDHLSQLISTASQPTRLVERAVVGLLRVIIRLLRREKMVNEVLPSLQILIHIQPEIWTALRRQISFGIFELMRTCSASITNTKDWATILLLLEYTGSQVPMQQATLLFHTSSTASEESDSGVSMSPARSAAPVNVSTAAATAGSSGDVTDDLLLSQWIQAAVPETARRVVDDFDSLARSCESLACMVRDRRMLNRSNIAMCVHAVRTLGQATSSGVVVATSPGLRGDTVPPTTGGGAGGRTQSPVHSSSPGGPQLRSAPVPTSANGATSPAVAGGVGGAGAGAGGRRQRTVETNHTNLSNQIMDLMHTLHDHATTLFVDPNDALPARQNCEQRWVWRHCWCPLQRGIAQFCCDRRAPVRQMAFTYLEKTTHRCFLYAEEWHACFMEVLFPLMSVLLRDIDPGHMEEMRKRASHLAIKVFLQHLGPLSQMNEFLRLWMDLLEFFHRFVVVGSTDLEEHIVESLKNALLVMATADVLNSCRYGKPPQSPAWLEVRKRITQFAPNLWNEVFRPATPASAAAGVPAAQAAQGQVTAPSQMPATLSADEGQVAAAAAVTGEVTLAPAAPAVSTSMPAPGGAAVTSAIVSGLPPRASSASPALSGLPLPASATGAAVVVAAPSSAAAAAAGLQPCTATVSPPQPAAAGGLGGSGSSPVRAGLPAPSGSTPPPGGAVSPTVYSV